MNYYPQTIIWRHRKENLKKCSLRGLEGREDCHFLTYPTDSLPSLEEYVLLAVDGEPLTAGDADQGLFLIDGTWRYAEVMIRQVGKPVQTRSLPRGFVTAYPRCQQVEAGLASVEALYAAYSILGRDLEGLLDNYFWKEQFLALNSKLLTC
ncbi:MAG: DUF367 domain-containing protein [Chlamydiia bacterium]|nr:DUF367 domain-containing protein [Chlamydiia bacterium]